MARLSRKLRVCKWVGTVGCALIAAAYIWSASSWLAYGWTAGTTGHSVWLTYGHLQLERVDEKRWSTVGWHHGANNEPFWLLSSVALVPGIKFLSSSEFIARLPLWLPFVLLLIPTIQLWRRARRKPRPGFCRVCDYDLTGNTTARCPECGTSCQPARDGAPPHAG